MPTKTDHASAEEYARPLAGPKHEDFPGLPSADALVNLARCYLDLREAALVTIAALESFSTYEDAAHALGRNAARARSYAIELRRAVGEGLNDGE